MFFSTGFPFGDFEGFGGGHPGGGPKKEVDTKKFYDSLGLPKDSSPAEIKKAYRKLAIQHHPDKGGDPEAFKEISKAYEVLSDPEKRAAYDQYGEEGVDTSGGAEPQDIFDLFFGDRRRGQAAQRKKKGEDILSQLKVTLSQLYRGATRKLAVNRDVLCPTCGGHGGPKDAIEKCGLCDGQGVRVQIRQIGPMIQQTQSKCHACSGEGSVMPASRRCQKCKGEKTVKDRKVVEIYVEPGAPNHHKVVFRGEADERPGEEPGDVVIVLEQGDHPLFKRKSNNLFMEKDITLYEALSGFKFVVEHLDERRLVIQNVKGDITKPADVRCVRQEGMPTHKNPFVKGDLFIVFSVVFPVPEFLDDKGRAQLRHILPQPDPLNVDEEAEDIEHHYVENLSPQSREQFTSGRSGEAYDEDDEKNVGGGQRMQCRQQ